MSARPTSYLASSWTDDCVFERSGTVVLFCVASCCGWFDIRRARFLGLHYLLLSPRTGELSAAKEALPARKSGSQLFHRILPIVRLAPTLI